MRLASPRVTCRRSHRVMLSASGGLPSWLDALCWSWSALCCLWADLGVPFAVAGPTGATFLVLCAPPGSHLTAFGLRTASRREPPGRFCSPLGLGSECIVVACVHPPWKPGDGHSGFVEDSGSGLVFKFYGFSRVPIGWLPTGLGQHEACFSQGDM